MKVQCFSCDEFSAFVCEACNNTGMVEISPTPPFSIEAMEGDDAVDPHVKFRFVDRDLADQQHAEELADAYAFGAGKTYANWNFIVSDSQGYRIKTVRCLPEPTTV